MYTFWIWCQRHVFKKLHHRSAAILSCHLFFSQQAFMNWTDKLSYSVQEFSHRLGPLPVFVFHNLPTVFSGWQVWSLAVRLLLQFQFMRWHWLAEINFLKLLCWNMMMTLHLILYCCIVKTVLFGWYRYNFDFWILPLWGCRGPCVCPAGPTRLHMFIVLLLSSCRHSAWAELTAGFCFWPTHLSPIMLLLCFYAI